MDTAQNAVPQTSEPAHAPHFPEAPPAPRPVPGPDLSDEGLDRLFSYHPPSGHQPMLYRQIRAAARTFAIAIRDCCPPSPDRTRAINHVTDATMLANASIARSGHGGDPSQVVRQSPR